MTFAAPRVEEDAARARLTPRRKLLRRGRPLRPERVELVYFPYHLFEVSVADAGAERRVRVALDGVLGVFSFVETDALDLRPEADGPRFPFRIGGEEAGEKALAAYRRALFGHVFHRLRRPTVKGVGEHRELYYPYWVAYYRTRKGYDFRAVDGIHGEPLSVRMRRAFLTAFAEGGLPTTV